MVKKQELIQEILDRELDMFLKVPACEPASCQDKNSFNVNMVSAVVAGGGPCLDIRRHDLDDDLVMLRVKDKTVMKKK